MLWINEGGGGVIVRWNWSLWKRFRSTFMGEASTGNKKTLELFSNSSILLGGSWLFCLQSFPCLVSFRCMFGGRVEVWTKNILYWFIEGQTRFSTYWVCQNEFDPQWTDIEGSLFKPPHDLQTCTKNLPNMENFVSETTDSLPKVTMS